MPFTVGGGLRNLDNITHMLHSGADKVSLNTAAIDDPDLILQAARKFGNQCIVLAIDAKRDGDSWRVFTHGGAIPLRSTRLNGPKERSLSELAKSF